MNKALDFIAYCLRPFYRYLFYFPFNIRIGKYPIYKQIQLQHAHLFRRFYKQDRIIKIKYNGRLEWLMKCNGSKSTSIDLYMIVGKIYEPDISKILISRIKDASIFIDVGANIGYYSVLSSVINPNSNIYSFEPVKETYQRLAENIELNKLKNITAYNIALGANKKTTTINLKNDLGHNSIVIDQSRENTGKVELINIDSLDNLIEFNNQKVFIKIDAEGYEIEVLKGMKNVLENNNCELIMEYSPLENQEKFTILRSILSGFSINIIRNNGKLKRIKFDELVYQTNQLNLFLKKINT
jgi:FkbM family methyltransferase